VNRTNEARWAFTAALEKMLSTLQLVKLVLLKLKKIKYTKT